MPESSTLPPPPDSARTPDPPRAEPPVAPGPRGPVVHTGPDLPTWLHVPAIAVASGMVAGIASVSAMALPAAVGLIPVDALPPVALWVALGTAWAAFTYQLLRSLGNRRPFLTGQIYAALLVVPAMSALIRWDFAAVEMSEFWVTVAVLTGVIGCVIGCVARDTPAPALIEVEEGQYKA
jgi:hypothetical protein